MESDKVTDDVIASEEFKAVQREDEELFDSLNIIEGDGSLENIHRV